MGHKLNQAENGYNGKCHRPTLFYCKVNGPAWLVHEFNGMYCNQLMPYSFSKYSDWWTTNHNKCMHVCKCLDTIALKSRKEIVEQSLVRATPKTRTDGHFLSALFTAITFKIFQISIIYVLYPYKAHLHISSNKSAFSMWKKTVMTSNRANPKNYFLDPSIST